MDIQRFATWAAVTVASLGIALHGYVSLFKADTGPNAFTLGLFVWSVVPYAICLLVALLGKGRPLLGLFGAAAALIADLNSYYSVFVVPDSSTAAIGLLFAPLINLVVFMPVGMLIGLALGRWLSSRAAP